MKHLCDLRGSAVVLLLSVGMSNAVFAETSAPTTPYSNYSELGYYVPKHVVRVSGNVTHSTMKVALRQGNTWTVEACPNSRLTERELSLGLAVVPDEQEFHVFRLNGGVFTALEYSFEVSDSGLLTGLDATSTGKTGSIFKSIGSLIGKAIPFLGGFLSADAEVAPQIADRDAKFDRLYSDKTSLCADPVKRSAAIKAWFGAAMQADVEAINTAISETSSMAQKMQQEQQEIAGTAANWESKDKAIASKERIAVIEALGTKLSSKVSGLKTVKAGLYDNFIKSKKLNPITEKKLVNRVLELDGLPAWCAGSSGPKCIRAGLTHNQVITALGNLPAANEFFKETGTILALKKHTAARPTILAEDYKKLQKDTKKGALLYTRNGLPADLAVFEQNGVYNAAVKQIEEKLILKEVSSESLLFTSTPATVLPLKKNAFAKRRLQLEFYDNGSLKKVGRESEAAAEKIFSSLNEATDNILSGYKNTVETLGAIQTSKFSQQNAARQAEIDALKREKELIDAEIALDGVSASNEQIRAKQLVDAELEFLTSQTNASAQKLKALKAQANLDNYGKPTGASELASLQQQLQIMQAQAQVSSFGAGPSDLQKLQAQLELLQTQLSILQTQKELSDQ